MIKIKLRYMVLVLLQFIFSGYAMAATVSEDFDRDNYTFSDSHVFFQGGRLFFEGASQQNADHYALWNGTRFTTEDIVDAERNTDTFYNLTLAVNVSYEGRDDNYGFGLLACMRQNDLGDYDFLRFLINNDGYFQIDMFVDDQQTELTHGWDRSSAILTNGQQNTLTITRSDDTSFSFTINGTVVGSYILTGLGWGYVGMVANNRVDAAFDDFELTTDAGDDDQDNVLPSSGSSDNSCFISNLLD